MIFKAELVRKVLSGAKTQTRRVVKPGEVQCRYRQGREYAVQTKRGGKGIAHIIVVDTRTERLGDITYQDAKAEGFGNRDQFFAYWQQLHGSVDVDLPVWVVTFRLAREAKVRLLHRDSSHGYTDKPAFALPREPEAVDEATQQQFSKKAERDWQKHYRPTGERPKATSLVHRAESMLRDELRDRYEGWDPEDIAAQAPQQGTPGEIRRRRTAIGVRAVDGLDPLADDEAARLLEDMVYRGCSVRDVARALDVSVGKAHKLIHETERRAA